MNGKRAKQLRRAAQAILDLHHEAWGNRPLSVRTPGRAAFCGVPINEGDSTRTVYRRFKRHEHNWSKAA